MSVQNNATLCYHKQNTSQPSLWDAPEESDRQQELIDLLGAWAVLNAHPALPDVGLRSGRANWPVESWDLERLETVHEAADLYSQRRRADFALSHWAIEHGHPAITYPGGAIGAGLTSWVEWSKGASLDDLRLVLETVEEAI